jgi:hypothetical protein
LKNPFGSPPSVIKGSSFNKAAGKAADTFESVAVNKMADLCRRVADAIEKRRGLLKVNKIVFLSFLQQFPFLPSIIARWQPVSEADAKSANDRLLVLEAAENWGGTIWTKNGVAANEEAT